MEILDRLKSIVGIGLPTIVLTGIERSARVGDVLRGVVVVSGGDHDVPITKLMVRLDRQLLVYTVEGGVDEPERQLQQHVVEVELPLDRAVLAAGERLEQTFALTVPSGLEPSAGPHCYAVVGECEVPGPNPRAVQPIDIVA